MIIVKNLYKQFGDLEVLKNVSCSIHEKEVVCVIGPSGSGKSTFLRCLTRLEEPTSGQVIIDGTEVTGAKTNINKVRQEVGMVFQRFNLFPHLTALQNIMLAPVNVRKQSKRKLKK